MVARCSRENMTSIIKQKIKSKRYDASDEKVYILLDEDDFDKENLSEMKKQHFTFPLFLPYDRIKQQIYDYETEEIDKIIPEVSKKKEKKEKNDYLYYEEGYIGGRPQKQKDTLNGKKKETEVFKGSLTNDKEKNINNAFSEKEKDGQNKEIKKDSNIIGRKDNNQLKTENNKPINENENLDTNNNINSNNNLNNDIPNENKDNTENKNNNEDNKEEKDENENSNSNQNKESNEEDNNEHNNLNDNIDPNNKHKNTVSLFGLGCCSIQSDKRNDHCCGGCFW